MFVLRQEIFWASIHMAR